MQQARQAPGRSGGGEDAVGLAQTQAALGAALLRLVEASGVRVTAGQADRMSALKVPTRYCGV